MRASRSTWQIHILVIVAYTLLALALTWPLAAHWGSHVPGNGVDDPPLTWNLWWVKYALLDQGSNPFESNHLFYPLGINLAFYTLTVLNGLLSIPLQAAVGLIPATNTLLLSTFVLGGYGTFLLAGHVLGTPASRPAIARTAAWVAGLLYAFASSKLFYAALGQWNIASSHWIPFYVLALVKTGEIWRGHRWRWPLLAALFLLCQAYAELTYATFLVLFTGLWFGWQLFTGRDWPRLGRLAIDLVVVGLLFLAGLSPMLATMLPDLLAEGNIFAEGGGFADVFSADLLGFLVPTQHHPLFGALVDRFAFDHSVGQHLYLGYSVLLLAVVGTVARWRRPGARFWVFSSLTFWLLTLGPSLRINGQDTGLPLPFALVRQIPFFEGNRYPSRYSVMLVLSLALLVAPGVHLLLERLSVWRARRAGRRSLVAAGGLLLAALLLFEHLSAPLPLSDMRVPAVYRTIARLPGDFVLLDLPVAWRNGARVTGTRHPIIMFEQYYQTAHAKRLLAGNTSRNPPLKFQYFVEAPIINSLIALEMGHRLEADRIERDRQLAADVLRFLDIQAIVVHRAHTGPAMVPYLEGTLPVQEMAGDGQTIAYRVELPPWPAAWTIEPGTELARLSYAEGWGLPAEGLIWAQRKSVRLLVPLNGGAQQMAFRAYAPGGDQRLRVEIEGQLGSWLSMAAGWDEYEVTLPAGSIKEGLNEVWLHFARLYPAGQVTVSSRQIGGTGVESPVNLAVHSAGLEVGDFAHIYVNGQDVAANERGYNLAVLDPRDGTIEGTAAFDTHLDPGASQALADFLRAVPRGRIVAVAVADEASRLLGPEAVAALQGLGARGDLRGRTRWGQAIVGVQGAEPGTALEASDWLEPVSVIVGEAATEAELAAALATITFQARPEP